MTDKDMITMSRKETKRLHIIHHALDKRITQAKAAELVGLSSRQLRRMIKRVREEGDDGISHRSRGRVSNRAVSPRRSKTKRLSCIEISITVTAPPLFAKSSLMIIKSS